MSAVFRHLYGILTPRERWQYLVVLLIVLMMALLEVAGVGAIFPFMSLLTRPGIIHEHAILQRIYDLLEFRDTRIFVLFAGIGLLALFLFKNLFAAFATWVQLKFIWNKHHSLSERLLRKYLSMPYPYFLTRNSSELSTNILSEVSLVISGIMLPAVQLVTQVLVVALLVGLLIWVDPLLALFIMSVLGGTYGAIYLLSKRRLKRLGEERQEANRLRFKTANEALGGIKEIIALGRAHHFLTAFRRPSKVFSDRTVSSQLVAELPRYAVETLAFGGMLGIMLYMFGTGQRLEQVIPAVSLYAMAGYRMVPAMQKIMTSLTYLRFNDASLRRLAEDVHGCDEAGGPDPTMEARGILPFRQEIRISGLSYRYPGTGRPVISDLDLCITRNTSVGLVGASGAGKTTLVDIIMGLLTPDQGVIAIDGVPLTAENRIQWSRNTGYVPQSIFLSDDTITRNIAFGIAEDRIDEAAVVRAAKAANLYDFVVNDLPSGFETLIGERGVRLSGGQRQRIGIARALYHDPEVLVLDEATSALDGATEAIITDSIQSLSRRKTLIIIAHRLTTVKNCDVICVFDQGRIVGRGTYEELMAGNTTFQSLARKSG